MDYAHLITTQTEYWQKSKLLLTKEEELFLTARDSARGKMTGFLTRGYYQRAKLIKAGHLVYVYTFKVHMPGNRTPFLYSSWAIFSPLKEFQNHPENYLPLVEKMQKFSEDKTVRGRKLRQLQNIIREPWSEPSLLELPEIISGGKLVYLHAINVYSSHLDLLNLGINMCIADPRISKEFIYLPKRYMTEEYRQHYFNEKRAVPDGNKENH